jgi:hypothetical protein
MKKAIKKSQITQIEAGRSETLGKVSGNYLQAFWRVSLNEDNGKHIKKILF